MENTMAVTVPGTSGPVTIAPGTGDVLNLATQIASLLATIQGAGNLSVTADTVGGAIASILRPEGDLHGSSAQYIVANDGGSLYVSDDQDGRDGARIISGDNTLTFTDGTGLFDPTGTAEDVYRLYKGALDRTASMDELKFWTALADNSHVSLASIANSFVTSPEFVQRYGALSNKDFVDQLYQNIFARAPDPAGEASWVASLAAGASRGSVALGIVESPEAKGSIAFAGDNNNGEVYRLYETAFGRAPEAGAESFWSSVLASGATVEQVAAAMAGTSEFQLGDSTLRTSDFVTRLYHNTFDRAPDDAGLQAWVAAINGGMSKSDVLVGFSDSLESRKGTSAATHANWVFNPSGSSANELLLNGPGGLNTSVPGGYNYIVVNDAAADTLSASNATVITNTVGGTFFVSGTSTVAATGGNNTVNATGNYTLSFGQGDNLIVASGSGTIATDIGTSTVVAANTSGPGNTIDSNGDGDVISTLFGDNTVNAAGDNATISGGLGNLTVSVTGSNDLILAGANSTTVTAGGDSSGLTVKGGAGPLEFVGGAGAATVFGGPGGSTIFGSSDVTFDGGGDLAYSAGSGSVTLNAALATGNVTASLAGSGADSITLGSGNDTIIAGSGAETLDAGAGSNQYHFDNALTDAVVVNESAANLANDTFSFASAPASSTTSGPLTLTLSDSTTITFTNLTNINQLHIP
jgi:hypothetical protein